MRKLAAYALLLIYLNAAAQALLPWISDGLAHAFNWQDHLTHVHDGRIHSHHVGLEMAAAEKDNAEHPVTTHAFSYHKDALSAHLVPAIPMVGGVLPKVLIALNADWLFHYRNVTGDVFLPPPDAQRISRSA